MAAVTIRNLPDDVHKALRVRAAQNGRSTEAEIRMILEEAVKPKNRLSIAEELAAFGDKYNLDLNIVRDKEPIRTVKFE